jgi:excisionase family DNA binding protein
MSIFMTADEVAQILGVSRRHVYKLMTMGIVPSVRPWGTRRKILRKDFEAWLQTINEDLGEGEYANGAHT